MNNSNNNIFDNNNLTSSQQNSNPTEVNSTKTANNSAQINQNTIPIQPQNNFNSKMNNNISNNNTNLTSVNPLPNNNINPQPTTQLNPTSTNNISSQNFTSINQGNDDELLKAFIGNSYEKITTRPFNFAGFFFTTFYMFYRKMFGYALLLFLLNLIVLNVINNFIITLAFNVAVGFLVNKIYLSYAKKKIAIIKASNSQKSLEELKLICSTKGGTSVGKIFLGFITELGIAFVVLFIMALIGIGSAIGNLFNFSNWNITTAKNSSKSGTLVENVSVSGYSCLGSKCNVTIESIDGNSEN